MTNEQYNLKLLKIAILSDILEAEIRAIDPNKTLLDKVFAFKMTDVKIRITNLRKYYDKLFSDKQEVIGTYYDIIDSAIDQKILEL